MPYIRVNILVPELPGSAGQDVYVWVDETNPDVRDDDGNLSQRRMKDLAVEIARTQYPEGVVQEQISLTPGADPPEGAFVMGARPAGYNELLQLYQGANVGDDKSLIRGNWELAIPGRSQRDKWKNLVAVAGFVPTEVKPPTTGDYAALSEAEKLRNQQASQLPGSVFRQYLQGTPGLQGLGSGPFGNLMENYQNLGLQAQTTAEQMFTQDPDVAQTAFAPTGYVPGQTYGQMLQQGGLSGIPALASTALGTLGQAAIGGKFQNLADPQTEEGRGDLYQLAYAAALNNMSPIAARQLMNKSVQRNLLGQWEDMLLQGAGGARPTFAGFLSERAGLGGQPTLIPMSDFVQA